MSQLGRISGAVLKDNLLRDGVDLAFRNHPNDLDLLYFDVTNKRIGINNDAPVYDLDVNNFFLTTDAIIDQQLKIDNFVIDVPNLISTQLGGITIEPQGPNAVSLINKLSTNKLSIDNNKIQSLNNENLIFDAGTNRVNLNSPTNIDADLTISGNTALTGDITIKGNLQIGDEKPIDTITIIPDFTQDILPGQDLTYDLGRVDLQWRILTIPDTSGIDLFNPFSVTVGDSIFLGGANKIETVDSNVVLQIKPDTGITFIEDIKIEENSIINLLDTPLTLKTTGLGYYKFAGDNALLIPAGDVSERPVTPEIGDTRWNTELDYLEVYNGTEYQPSVGEGDEVTQAEMEEISYLYSLILG
jgi:hypothetical protein